MKCQFEYWDNSKYPLPPTKLFEVVSEDIVDADKAFTNTTGIIPVKTMTIGVRIKKVSMPIKDWDI